MRERQKEKERKRNNVTYERYNDRNVLRTRKRE